MSGKALLIVVLGFTIIFMIMGYFWGGIATRSTENHVSYYSTTVAHTIAVSGANIGLQKVIYTYNTTGDLPDGNIVTEDFEGGEMVVDIDTTQPVKVLTSKGYFPKGSTEPQIVKVKLLQDITSMARYAWFIPSVSTGASNQRPWITGDKIWGGFHSNQFLNVYGEPIFYGKVTTLKGIKDWGEGSDPQFLGGYDEGISVSWEMNKKLDVQKAAAIEGQATAGAMCYFDKISGKKVNNVWLQFNEDGTVTYRTDTNNSGDNIANYSAAITMDLKVMAPNGIIYIDNGDVYMSGTLNGKVTVVADGASGFGGPGNVYLVGDMINHIRPMMDNGSGGYMINPDSRNDDGTPVDMMGIIARNNISVATSEESGGKANNVDNPNINIDGGIICMDGGFTVQDLNSLPGPTGNITLQGSMVAGKEEIVANFDGLNITQGYNRIVIFDDRFATGPPTWFPYLYYYKVMSWLE